MYLNLRLGLKYLEDFPSSHVLFVGLMNCTICSRSTNHGNADKEIIDFHVTHLCKWK